VETEKVAESPFLANVPDTLQDVFLMKRIASGSDTKGWAYAVFDYEAASDTFKPDPTGTVNCGFACHTVDEEQRLHFSLIPEAVNWSCSRFRHPMWTCHPRANASARSALLGLHTI